MSQAPPLLLKSNLKQLRLTELEVATRGANALKARIRQASFPVDKDFDTFDFSVAGTPPKQKLLELARGELDKTDALEEVDERHVPGTREVPGPGNADWPC